MTEPLNGIPRVDPTADPPWTLRVVARILSTELGSVVHRHVMAPLDGPLGYFTDGDDVILIASNYGQVRHPSWYYNLRKKPQCQLFPEGRADRAGHFVARLTEGADHDRLFDLAAGYAANFASYAIKTEGIRAINVFRLSPA